MGKGFKPWIDAKTTLFYLFSCLGRRDVIKVGENDGYKVRFHFFNDFYGHGRLKLPDI